MSPGLQAADPATVTRLEQWFQARGQTPQPFQRDTWAAWLAGRSGLIHAPTGTGKTLAAFGGPLLDPETSPGLRLLWLTPLRALATDTAQTLNEAATSVRPDWRVGHRTGDTPAPLRTALRRNPPQVLVTTPESLAVLLASPDHAERFATLRTVVVDEWHELLGSKRGLLLQLCLARVQAVTRAHGRGLRVWGLSATLADPRQALAELLPPEETGVLIAGPERPAPRLDLLWPGGIERLPGAGHYGLHQCERVVAAIEAAERSLVFTHTRAQAERWFAALLAARPDWLGEVALHHGSLAGPVREAVEQGLRERRFRAVVATSSLDLGVDFPAVEQVLQIGGPKGLARLLQRAGRSNHVPGGRSRLVCVPTHALEALEFLAARRLLARPHPPLEPRPAPPLGEDVLIQHLVTRALGGGFTRTEIGAELALCPAGATVGPERLDWALEFITRGGAVLEHYPEFQRVRFDAESRRYGLDDPRQARRHRLAIGVITRDGMIRLRQQRGAELGLVEEGFIARLRPGDCFQFAGRSWALVRLREQIAEVQPCSGQAGPPQYLGGRLPLSSQLAEALQSLLHTDSDTLLAEGVGEEVRAAGPLLDLQRRWSEMPGEPEPGARRQGVLVESIRTREGQHWFLYPFAGRLAHEGLASLLAWALSRRQPLTLAFTANDYGLELVGKGLPPPTRGLLAELLDECQGDKGGEGDEARLRAALHQASNARELARRHFRDIAQIAGLVFPGYPGAGRAARQLQLSASLLFDTLSRHDPGHPLLAQAEREALEQQLDWGRLTRALAALRAGVRLTTPPRLTPFALPLYGELLRARLSSEAAEARLTALIARLGQAASRRARA